MTISVAVAGATGRLGAQIRELVEGHEDFALHAAMDSSSSVAEMDGADVLIDATNIDVSERLVAHALEAGMNVVVGTSGWDAAKLRALESRIPKGQGVLVVPNFSVGSVLGTHLATIAGQFFDSIEIIEAHHEHKADSPSGTAVRTAESIAEARTRPLSANNAEQPARGQLVDGIPIHSMRLRGVVADQQVVFGGQGETLTIQHLTTSSAAYAHGIEIALHAVGELAGLTVGLQDLLGLTSADQRATHERD